MHYLCIIASMQVIHAMQYIRAVAHVYTFQIRGALLSCFQMRAAMALNLICAIGVE